MALVAGLVVFLARRTAALLAEPESPIAGLSRRAIYLNVVVSHGLVLAVALLAAWLTGIPRSSFGLDAMPSVAQVLGLLAGLLVLNEMADRLLGGDENALRDLLAPASPAEWATLAIVVLPTVALSEELLFRGVLIGAAATGTDLSPALLVAGSAILFGAAHSAQGTHGVVAATVLGLLLGVAFHLTGSLVFVVLVHYALDLAEFLRYRDQARPSSARQY